jgi:hypothetical protein
MHPGAALGVALAAKASTDSTGTRTRAAPGTGEALGAPPDALGTTSSDNSSIPHYRAALRTAPRRCTWPLLGPAFGPAPGAALVHLAARSVQPGKGARLLLGKRQGAHRDAPGAALGELGCRWPKHWDQYRPAPRGSARVSTGEALGVHSATH